MNGPGGGRKVAVRGTKGADERSVPSFKGFTEGASPVSFSVGSGSQMIFSSLWMD